MGLRAIEDTESTDRRFGHNADARWASFRGHLGTAERIDLLVRDAAVKWGSAFSPATIFRLPGLASDEPFGPDWASLPELEANRLWASGGRPTSIEAAAEALGIKPSTVDLPTISPSTRLIVGGGAAIISVASHFERNRSLSWADQVLVVAEKPEHRQLAGLVAPLLYATGPTLLVLPLEDATTVIRKAGFPSGGVGVVSPDAAGSVQAFVRQATGG